ncbi:MAG: TRAP transporter substrate-binding protein DctP [Lachnospiraceae bacterium]|nr:TRAP transporter substrate-binding protein DctP [Lachnospiraceae bacterium]
MKKNVRMMALALSAMMAFSMTGCGSSDSQSAGTTAAKEETSAAGAPAESEAAGESKQEPAEGATVFKLGTTVNEQDSFQVAAEKFAELVAERTNHAYAIEIYPNGTLGGERDMLESMQIGTLDMGIITSGPFINFSSAMGVLDMPYLFASNEEAYAVLDGEIGRELLDTLEDSGLKGLAYAERGFRNLTNSVKPIQTAADLSGMTIRIMENDVYTASFQAMDVNATPMAWADALTALQQGTVQGQENPINVIYSYSLWESQKYVTLDRHSYSTAIITMSAALFDSLDADTQQIFLDAAQEAAEYERAWVADQESSQLQALKDNGMEVIENPDLASFKEAVQPVYDQYSEYSDYVARIQEVIANMQ